MTKNIHNISPIIKLELLGIGSIRYLDVKARLEEAIAELGLDLSITEIKDIDHILENDISGIPALKVNNQIVFQNSVPSVEEIKAEIQ
ncbi:MAG: thioredoxin family protein, partial [Bacteroidota bacterium]